MSILASKKGNCIAWSELTKPELAAEKGNATIRETIIYNVSNAIKNLRKLWVYEQTILWLSTK